MIHARLIITSLGSALVAATLASPAAAVDGPKTFVSQFGNDMNSCLTPFVPCRTAQRGIDQTLPLGEVVFDTGGDFGTATIDKPLTLNFLQHGQMDVPLSGNPSANLIINTGAGDDRVTISGLRMNLNGANRNGIQVNRGSLFMTDALIQNGDKCGLFFQPNANGRFTIARSIFLNNQTGICVAGRSGADITGVLDEVDASGNVIGLRSASGPGSLHKLVLQSSTVSGNTIGVQSQGGGSSVGIKNSLIFGNGTGLSHTGGGLIPSLTGNSLTGNTIPGTFTSTVPTQ
jgi:hypothetical protein